MGEGIKTSIDEWWMALIDFAGIQARGNKMETIYWTCGGVEYMAISLIVQILINEDNNLGTLLST